MTSDRVVLLAIIDNDLGLPIELCHECWDRQVEAVATYYLSDYTFQMAGGRVCEKCGRLVGSVALNITPAAAPTPPHPAGSGTATTG